MRWTSTLPNKLVPDSKAASGHWSGERGFIWLVTSMDHPLDGPVHTLEHRKIDYAVAYHQSSPYVHGSFVGLEGLFPYPEAIYTPRKAEGDEQEGQKTLFNLVQYIHQAVRYALFGMELEDTSSIDAIYRNTQSKLEPLRVLHKR
jgi:hypothetical protein